MQRILVACLLAACCPAAKADNRPEEFREAFARHQANGTLLHHETPREFEAKGWGELYRDAMGSQFEGQPCGGLRLEVSTRDTYAARVGDKVDLVFHLENQTDEKIEVTTAGSCKTVHQAGFLVIDPRGRLWQSLGRMVVGGPHCFCRQYPQPLNASAKVKLDTQTDSSVVVGFAPHEPGKYVIIGSYDLPSRERLGRRVLSAPLVLHITGK